MNSQFNEEKFSLVTEAEARKNAAYWQMIQPVLAKNKPVLELPDSKTAIAHATTILEGKFEKLDFTDPHFFKNILHALRLNALDRTDMALALILFEGKKLFGGEIQRFDFSDQHGPYSPATISYANPSALKNFGQQLGRLDPKECCYFTINFTKKIEAMYLYVVLKQHIKCYELNRYQPLREDSLFACVLNSYLDRIPSRFNKELLTKKQVSLYSNDSLETVKAAAIFLKILHMNEENIFGKTFFNPIAYKNLPILEYNSMEIFVASLGVGEQIPSLCMSPDYTPEDPHSPLLAIVVPHLNAFKSLIEGFHSGNYTFFYSFENYQRKMLRDQNCLPLKLYMPGENEKINDIDFLPFVSTWREFSLHWRMSASYFRAHASFLDEVITAETGSAIDGSRQRLLAETCFNDGSYIREELAAKRDPQKFIIAHFNKMLSHAGNDFWNCLDKSDINLVLMINMLTNTENWQKAISYCFMKKSFNVSSKPSDFFSSANMLVEDKKTLINYGRLHEQLILLNKIIDSKKHQSAAYYILRYRLLNYANSEQVCEELRPNLKNLLVWNAHGQLQLAFNNCALVETMSAEELVSALRQSQVTIAEQEEFKNNSYAVVEESDSHWRILQEDEEEYKEDVELLPLNKNNGFSSSSRFSVEPQNPNKDDRELIENIRTRILSYEQSTSPRHRDKSGALRVVLYKIMTGAPHEEIIHFKEKMVEEKFPLAKKGIFSVTRRLLNSLSTYYEASHGVSPSIKK